MKYLAAICSYFWLFVQLYGHLMLLEDDKIYQATQVKLTWTQALVGPGLDTYATVNYHISFLLWYHYEHYNVHSSV